MVDVLQLIVCWAIVLYINFEMWVILPLGISIIDNLILMKEEKRRLIDDTQLTTNKNIQCKAKDIQSSGPSLNEQKLNPMQQQAKLRKRIITKRTSITHHAQSNETKYMINLNENIKVQNQNVQVKEFKKKLKRVGKKVWVTAFKQSIDDDKQNQQTNLAKDKENNNANKTVQQSQNQQVIKDNQTHLMTPKNKKQDQFQDFKQQCTTAPKTQKKQKFQTKIKNNGKSQINKYEQNQILILKHIVDSIKVDDAVERSREYLKNIGKVNGKESTARSVLVEQPSETRKIVVKINNFGEGNHHHYHDLVKNEDEDIDIDKMLQQIQNQHMEHNVNHGQHASRNPRSSKFQSQIYKKNSQSSHSGLQNKTTNIRKNSYLKKQGNSNKKIGVKSSQDSDVNENINKGQSGFKVYQKRQSVSLHMKSSKKPLPPTNNFSQERVTRNMYNSQHSRNPRLIKQTRNTHNVVRQSVIITAPSSIMSSKLELTPIKPQQQPKTEIPIKNSSIFQSLHSSQKKQIGSKKVGIQKFRNLDGNQTNKITSSLKRNNKNLQMNWYIMEARKQIVSCPFSATPI